MPRLFVAVELPDSVKEALLELQQRVFPAARWSKRAQMHLTLHFIGAVPNEQCEAIKTTLATVKQPPFDLKLRGVGVFPQPDRARVLWAGIVRVPGLLHLHHHIGEALKPTGFTPEDRPYTPHVTLARFQSSPPRDSVQKYLLTHQRFVTDQFTIREFVLFSSDLQPAGAVYTPEQVYPLAIPPS
jgi:2'-5' RNA ligase